ncbi:hypothetical protein EXIGLDRAFT_775638 [Exidia glandulosa HHB12029]|uniref:Uncharacterized protein n=1 Tax=Exidia glandulosa HHB12029 TaxID=1314781 RepID=A0A165DTY2_EXIGL|nr:hypothetical protein EXIGLDRAFT_775638 [Exidia glandulosa HHB12029]
MAAPFLMKDLVGGTSPKEQAAAAKWLADFTKFMVPQTAGQSPAKKNAILVDAFQAHIATGSQAEDWWNNTLSERQRKSWEDIKVNFSLAYRTPAPRTIEPSEYFDEFKKKLLTMDEAMKKVPIDGSDNTRWGYVVWAEEIEALGVKTGITASILVQEAMALLPAGFAQLMETAPHGTWSEWCEALRELQPTTITRTQSQYTDLANIKAELKAFMSVAMSPRSGSTSPTRDSSGWYSMGRGTTPPPGYPSRSASPSKSTFPQVPPSPGTLAAGGYTPYQAYSPSPHPPSTPQAPPGRAQLAAQSGFTTPRPPLRSPFSPVPIKLRGTASAEDGCIRCGELASSSHNRWNCTNPPLPQQEQRYHETVLRNKWSARTPFASASFPPTPSPSGRRAPAEVAQISLNDEPDDYALLQVEEEEYAYEEESEGKGEEAVL